MSTLMAVDVGGSGLRALVRRDGASGAVREAPGARIGARGLDVSALVAATGALLDGRAPDVLVFAARGMIALAGPDAVLSAVGSLGAARTVVCSDAVSSLAGALGAVRPGAVVAAGTGAVALGSDFDRLWRRVDGWGHVLGDRGSAAWIGLQVLRALLREQDLQPPGSAGPTGLMSAATDRFGPVQQWPRAVMTRQVAPEMLGRFACAVTQLAASEPAGQGAATGAHPRGSALAAQVCRRAGGELAASLLAAAAPLPPDAPLSAVGGLLHAGPVRHALERAVAGAGRALQPAAGTSLDGAMLLAEHVEAQRLTAHPPELLVC